jgi:hypothetical protein
MTKATVYSHSISTQRVNTRFMIADSCSNMHIHTVGYSIADKIIEVKWTYSTEQVIKKSHSWFVLPSNEPRDIICWELHWATLPICVMILFILLPRRNGTVTSKEQVSLHSAGSLIKLLASSGGRLSLGTNKESDFRRQYTWALRSSGMLRSVEW